MLFSIFHHVIYEGKGMDGMDGMDGPLVPQRKYFAKHFAKHFAFISSFVRYISGAPRGVSREGVIGR